MAEQRKYNNRTNSKPKAQPISDYGRIQPQALELEEAVLGALMIEKDAYSQVSEILRPDSFYERRHQLIYSAITDLAINQKPVDILTVKEQLAKRGELDEVGGPFYITQLSSKVASSAHIEYHARIIAQKYLARELITFTSNIQGKAFDETLDVDDLMQEAEGKLFEISQQNLKKDYTQINPIIAEAYDLLQKAAARTDGLSGLESGFTKLDKMTAGWQNSDLVIIAARPAMGKTAFVLSMARNIAVNFKHPVALFSLEMSNVQLVNRLIVNVCEIPGEKIKSGQLAAYEWQQLDYKLKDLIDAPLYVDDTPSLSVFELRTKARRLVREHGVKIIIIDYLQLMNASGMSFGSRQEEVSTISRSLKGLAKELNIPIIALSQLNRGVENREGIEGKRPQLSDLRESGAIEQDADMVCFIHRPEYYKILQDDRGNDLRGMAEIIIAKHRNGATGDVLLRFKGEFARFQNPDDDMVIPMPTEGAIPMLGSRMNNASNVPPPSPDYAPQMGSPFGGPGNDGPLPF
ncbi:replicative DNA helicase [Bacteroides sp.]|uniref:replicative DNA helicase n=1 Tax=Bacteroides sp. TaxID=29523 RepID=UPI001B538EE2|nr:replicative DNA helicase [Bacteroides sp.]MBP6065706.1 replicative DNA helicase [Bacteroides sp.]MBP6067977.1 replicative DNA helicase [Bacteroides sp.]MBP6936770.1 replicative DNA helicase [Bacteroides sp.]MBP8622451.1 replicative DNA helicase [Bacteroides sp.]MBP9586058.1 replicative DNA helicase [Bacteroides sp.]